MTPTASPTLLTLALSALTFEWDSLEAIGNYLTLSWDGSFWTTPDEPVAHFFDPPRVGGGRYADPASLTAMASARIIKRTFDASLLPDQLGCVIGTRVGNAVTIAHYEAARLAGRRASPIQFAHAGWNVPTALTAAQLECRGYGATVCAGENSGEEAFQTARRVLARGRVEAVVTGVVALSLAAEDRSSSQLRAACLLCLLQRGIDQSIRRPPLDTNRLHLPQSREWPMEISLFANSLAHWNPTMDGKVV